MMATGTPTRDPLPANKYRCVRCGIEREKDNGSRVEYCRDCIKDARAFGWAPPDTRTLNAQARAQARARQEKTK